ncbi:MAG TPA: FmdB family zinc ribbon protein [Thermodesulfovibrionales bacterium]|nr:FmdB family zinc ribbon protein [Thermodesulfovibrionales bacterium]
MPIYEYTCLSCKRGHEIMQKYDDAPLTICPDCGGDMKKLISNTSFVLKGKGWYKTDYASDNGKKPKETEKKTETPSSSEKKNESKSEAA